MSFTRKRRPLSMPFGKHKGTKISELPDDYLQWLLSLDLREPLKSAVENEYQERECADNDGVPGVNVLVIDEIVSAGVRALSKKYHPDVGGDHRKMVSINQTADWIREQVRRISE
jgi:hypothetical protein